jgi:Carboxypeptidase regulatory-like domain
MQMRIGLGVVVCGLALLTGNASVRAELNVAPVGTLEGRIVEGTSLVGVEGATVVVTDTQRGPVVASGTTDANGWFHYRLPPGTYDVLAIFGDARWIHLKTKVELHKVTQVAGALSLESEMITIHEDAPKKEHRSPEPVRSTMKPILPYSDQAIDENVWTVGWMLLDVSEKGVVTSFRFLHRPGYGLDEIAEREIWSLRFVPARDDSGQPMVSKVLWKLEWPSFHYAKQHKLVGLGGEGALTPATHLGALHDQVADRQLQGGEFFPNPDNLNSRYAFVLPDGEHRPPCKASGQPMNLDMHEPIYRDCTPPTLGNVNSEPVISRPDK